jgi:hypothetical protein
MAKSISTNTSEQITQVKIRMYCLGTGDCFIYKFFTGAKEKFTMMVDCGSCTGTDKEFLPYVTDLKSYVKGQVDLLVVTHEHNDHVNGFSKCKGIFETITFKKAWFAWTENPDDPEGKAKKLQKKRTKMKMALANAINEITKTQIDFENSLNNDFFKPSILESRKCFVSGIKTLSDINLDEKNVTGAPLAGMTTIKTILKNQKTTIEYLEPGTVKTIKELKGLKFHVLGPPAESTQVFKEGKQGTDVYNKKFLLNTEVLSLNAFLAISEGGNTEINLPFSSDNIINDPTTSLISKITQSDYGTEKDYSKGGTVKQYHDAQNAWRKIDTDWLQSSGTLALRLNSHINNTSLVLAIESEKTKNVLLLPGDAEFGSWESWHMIAKWNKKGKDGKHLVEDLLNRTIFYKIGHHLSYNGTAFEKGIMMMEHPDLIAFGTLDLNRISQKWKSTMPNSFLLKELIKKCEGKVFIMNETGIINKPSKKLDPKSLPKSLYEESVLAGTKTTMYKQYNLKF